MGRLETRREQRSCGNAVFGRETVLIDWTLVPWGAGPGLRLQPRPPACPASSLLLRLCFLCSCLRMSVRMSSRAETRQTSNHQGQSCVACQAERVTGRHRAALPLPESTLGPLGLRLPTARHGCWLVLGDLCWLSRERGLAATIKAERGKRQRHRDGETGRGSSFHPGPGCGGSTGGRPGPGSLPVVPAMCQPAARPDSPGRLSASAQVAQVCFAGPHLGESRGRPTQEAGHWVTVGAAGGRRGAVRDPSPL